ncbi:hypothetical protein FA15DRAFT_505041 [Coprinopsis marcescibilis]|uniref:GST N-terminal domain-containing protein n=1 Tax=Coprinopsis marcescibilis TaxID=230819 RepID=A0A5C3KQR4_COPMA|nr:hypothetical protein FA15DRAFT_505041 [Coprinopsis marcescibilis]
MITLYDIPAIPPLSAWSPNTWKTRFTLNYKDLPYKTEWIEYPDITPLYKEHNIAPTGFYPDGSAYHSLPVIKDEDESTGEVTYVAESLEIAKYLDKKYPAAPKVVLEEDGTEGELLEKQKAFKDEIGKKLMFPFFLVLFKGVTPKLNPRSAAHFNIARAKDLSLLSPDKPVSNLDQVHLSPEEAKEKWQGLKKGFADFGERYFGGKGELTWLLGDKISFGDFILGGFLLWIKTAAGEESLEWQDLLTWDDGKWKSNYAFMCPRCVEVLSASHGHGNDRPQFGANFHSLGVCHTWLRGKCGRVEH